jgi:hypothetical protein
MTDGVRPQARATATQAVSDLAWKENWSETRQHLVDWWRRDGLVISGGWYPRNPPHAEVADPGPADTVEAYADGVRRAERSHFAIAQQRFPGDNLPISGTDIGPGSLALFLGSEPGFSPNTVWFKPSMHGVRDPESLPPLTFDPDSQWWKVTETTCRACAERARGQYLVGCPDLVENIDILAALRDPQTLMFDMIERPGWVERKVEEINRAFFEAYDRIYDIIKLPDGSSAFGAFALWGPGKTVKVQCDACAMFSPAMFGQFVLPSLAEQCSRLDYTMFHLDGTQCIDKLDLVLSIEALDAVEWTPETIAAGKGGGHPDWYDLYRRILKAGKSVQAIGVRVEELKPLLDAIGTKGVYIQAAPRNPDEAEQLLAIAATCR